MHFSRPTLRGWLPVLIWMGLIFLGSTDLLAAAHTSRFVEPLLRWLFGGHLTPDHVAGGHFLIRKTGHLTEYAVLSILLWRALSPEDSPTTSLTQSPRPRHWRHVGLTLFLSACYAGTDEFHQWFVPSRGAGIEDVLIDTVGAAMGLTLLWLRGFFLPAHPLPPRVAPAVPAATPVPVERRPARRE